MLAFLLAAGALLTQAIPPPPNQAGTVTGLLRTPAGMPAPGVRVAALARPDALKDLALASSYVGLGETDAAGRYRLENIPAGSYYIIAGRVDAPTFYPGTLQANNGTLVQVTAGSTVSGIDFVLNNDSAGRAVSSQGTGVSWTILLQTIIEGGGKVPLFGDGRFPVLRFTRAGGQVPQVSLSLYETQVSLLPGDYRVTVENLPDGYALKTLTLGTLGATDLRAANLQLAAAIRAQAVPLGQPIVVTLTAPAATPRPGVRVAGRIRGDPNRSIYISGKAGTIYSDGSFEFLGVSPGMHIIVTRDHPGMERPAGAAIVVATRDVLGVELEEITVAPGASDNSTEILSAGNRTPGSRVAPTFLRGRIIDAETKIPFNAGKAYVNGDYAAGVSLDEEGRFEFPKLLPGRYNLEVFVFGVGNTSRPVVIGDEAVSLDLSLGP
jgi:hypothetical protein